MTGTPWEVPVPKKVIFIQLSNGFTNLAAKTDLEQLFRDNFSMGIYSPGN
jgi:hypothetical protein